MSPLPPKLSYQLLQRLYFNVLDLLLTSSIFVEVGGGGLTTCQSMVCRTAYFRGVPLDLLYSLIGVFKLLSVQYSDGRPATKVTII